MDDDLARVLHGIRAPISLRERLLAEHLRQHQINENSAYGKQYAELVGELILDVPDEEFALARAISAAGTLVDGLASACHVGSHIPGPPPPASEVWRHRDLKRAFEEGYTSSEASHGNTEDLSQVAHIYLSQGMRSPTFEWALVDAMAAAEIYAFGEALKESPLSYSKWAWTHFWRVDKQSEFYRQSKGKSSELTWLWYKHNLKIALAVNAVLFVGPLLVAWAALANNLERLGVTSLIFWAAVTGVRLIRWVLHRIRGIFRDPGPPPLVKAAELLEKMLLAYHELRGGPSSSPKRVRELLARAADEGAVWPPAVFAVLDLAISRSKGGWG